MAKTKSTPAKSSTSTSSNGTENGSATTPRLNVLKTYKMYIGGKFPRTESGRFDTLKNSEGEMLANICRGSRKDFRNAVQVARKAQSSWAANAALLRGQILYRIAEMLEGRRAQFVEELKVQGLSPSQATQEVDAAIDRMVYYAGWCDKYQQVFSAVNPVASSHFNFSIQEPTGIVSVFAPEENGLLGLVSVIAPIIAGGNTCVVLASSKFPMTAITFAEVLNSSDVPSGVVNLITGRRDELMEHFSTHMDVNAMVFAGQDQAQITQMQQNSVHNIKRIVLNKTTDWFADTAQSPYRILETQEVKTTWHPIGV
ncbi:MAG TPA: aldehyde dehydrogenase family protein [Bacteroidetes bacterium]|nr:aldehyde dehydrogenase family protein [Bacteroidota bacterium]